MDLLKDITRELRGRGETRRDERVQTTANSRREADRRGSTGDPDESPDENATDRSRGDEHVCPFCETEFEATRGSCPDCDAEIVFRGER